MRNTRRSRGFLALAVLTLFVFVGTGLARELREVSLPEGTDARPSLVWGLHNLGNVWSAFLNLGRFGDPDANYPSMEWPGGSGSYYLWAGNFWTACYGDIATGGVPDKYASCSDYGDWELWPSEGYPMTKLVPGPTALEETQYAYDDWYENSSYQEQERIYGMMCYEENYSWGTPGYNNFIANKFVITHHPDVVVAGGGSGNPLDGLLIAVRGDCDIATADPVEAAIEDMVYYDGHCIWLSGDPNIDDFDYEFQDGTKASEQDEYTYQQNPDSPLDPEDPNNIWYYYNYIGSDGVLDNDVDADGVSDHYTILFKYATAGTDTIYPVNSGTGIEMFTAGNRPENYWLHVSGDTTYAVIPRNMSYMWDGDGAGSSIDDSGEQQLDIPCVGFIAWRLLDCWVKKTDGTIERPVDVHGVPIPISHAWWNWESDPGTDMERYDYMWGLFPDEDGQVSGPSYLEDWVSNPNTPEARIPENPGPWPFVYDNPLALGYPTFDYRFLPSIGPVTLDQTTDSLFIIGGWIVDQGLDGCRRAADELLSAYYLGETGWDVPALPPTPILFYEAQDNAVYLEWGANAEAYSPFGGYNVYRSEFEPSNWELVGTVTEPGVHSFTDNTAMNGFPYYYVVCAYDAETGVESTKSNYKQTLEGTPVAVVPSWDTDTNWTENVRVVPNPYRISAAWEQTYFNKIAFTNLPSMCDIHIFTLDGDHVITLEHRDYSGEVGTEYWDLVSRNDQDVVSGLYVYRVETENDFVIDKFAIIK